MYERYETRKVSPGRMAWGLPMVVWSVAVWFALATGIGAVISNEAAAETVITGSDTTVDGEVKISLFLCADEDCRHGHFLEVTVPLAAGTSALDKARAIEKAIKKAARKQRMPIKVVRNGAQVSVYDNSEPRANRHGVEVEEVEDSTGEYDDASVFPEDPKAPPYEYVTTARLEGMGEGDYIAAFGENGLITEVPTWPGMMPMDVYEMWRDALGGTIQSEGLVLEPQLGTERSLQLQVSDPGLSISVTQRRVLHWRDADTRPDFLGPYEDPGGGGRLTITDQGTLGFLNDSQLEGSGLVYPADGQNQLYIGSFWAGTGPDYVAARDYAADPGQEWTPSTDPLGLVQTEESDIYRQVLRTRFNDDNAAFSRGIHVEQAAEAYRISPDFDDFVILRYVVRADDLDLVDLFAGVFLDLNVGAGLSNIGGSDPDRSLVWIQDGAAGVCDDQTDCLTIGLLYLGSCDSNQPAAPLANLTLIRNSDSVWPDGYVLDPEKIRYLTGSNPDYVLSEALEPDDYSVLASADLSGLVVGEERELAFAVVGGASLNEMLAHADRAREICFDGVPANVPGVGPVPGTTGLGEGTVPLWAYPNPSRGATEVRFTLDRSQDEEFEMGLDVYDASGRKVRSLFNGILSAGPQAIAWDGTDDDGIAVTSGVYFVKASGPGGTGLGRITVIR